jgi:hypothetical protein
MLNSRVGFLIIGAQKAGTTSLFEYMRRHPQIHMPAEKEIGFFHVDRNYRRGWDWYQTTVLRDAPPDSVSGEASVGSMSGTPFGDTVANEHGDSEAISSYNEPLEEIVPSRIKNFLPDIKLICVLRDPVRRAYSHYRMEVLDRVEHRSFDNAIEELTEPRSLESARIAPTRINSYIVNGEYARILSGFLRVFPHEQLMVIFSDELDARPAETLAAVYGFIGVADDFISDNLNIHYRTAAAEPRIARLDLAALQIRVSRARQVRAVWHTLPVRMRDRISRIYNLASFRVGVWNARRNIPVPDDDISPLTLQRLTAHFRPDSEALGSMLDRDIPWLATWARS